MIFDGLQIGGIERVGADYAKLLRQLGHEVTIINLVPKFDEMVEEYPNDCKYQTIKYPRWLAPERYSKLVKMNFWGRYLYPCAYTFFSLANIVYKFICQFLSFSKIEYDLAIAFSGHYDDLTFVTKKFVKTKHKMCWLHGALYGYLLISDGYFNLHQKMKNLVVLVDDAQEEVQSYNRFCKFNIHKLYNPVCLSDKPIDNKLVSELKNKYGRFLLMVSRISYPHKDQFTVATALKVCREKYGDDLNLVFVGDGPDKIRVEEFVQSMGEDISSHIFFEGSRMDVQNYYASAYMLVHASVAGEGLPTVMLEAMEFGLPMVVTDSKVGPREILGNDEYGLLCRVQDPEDMAQKIHSMYSDRDLYENYQTKEKIRLCDFKPEVIKKQLQSVLEDVCKAEE